MRDEANDGGECRCRWRLFVQIFIKTWLEKNVTPAGRRIDRQAPHQERYTGWKDRTVSTGAGRQADGGY